jgi:hypothetical protein
VVDHGGDSFSLMRASHAGRTVGSEYAELPLGAARCACCAVNFSEA